MNTPPRFLVLCAVLVFAYAAVSSAAEPTGITQELIDIRIEMKDGSLSMETRDAPLHEVMRRIGELAGFKTILVGDFIDPPLVNVSFNQIPVREAVERLVSDKNRIILYGQAGDDTQQSTISQVWLLQSGDDVASDAENIALGREDDVKGHKLARLTRMLQQDQNTPVRARAAIALGTFQDERAVLALETALLDKEPLVRSQAIKALGRIRSEQATIALGNILLRGSADKSERIMASRALWNQDSEIAQDYLRAAANDTDAQIRTASTSNPSSTPKVRNANDQSGESETQ
jgi:HEAT repeat protein